MNAGEIWEVVSNVKVITITTNHMKLLSRMYVTWDWTEFGAPAIDPKRPYGNSSVLRDIAEILDPKGLEAARTDGILEEEYFEKNEKDFLRIHAEMGLVLQIGIVMGEFFTGTFKRSGPLALDWTYEGSVKA